MPASSLFWHLLRCRTGAVGQGIRRVERCSGSNTSQGNGQGARYHSKVVSDINWVFPLQWLRSRTCYAENRTLRHTWLNTVTWRSMSRGRDDHPVSRDRDSRQRVLDSCAPRGRRWRLVGVRSVCAIDRSESWLPNSFGLPKVCEMRNRNPGGKP